MSFFDIRKLCAVAGALAYLACSYVFARAGPGVEYDEALSVRGARMLVDSRVPCRADLDIAIGHKCLPLMVAPYVGATKAYLVVPLFRAGSTTPVVARMGAAVLVAVCLFFCALSLQSTLASALFVAAFLVNPVVYGLPIFDDTNLAAPLAILGLTVYFLSRAQRSPTPVVFFLLGIALGLGGWARLNFIWIWFALLGAAVWIYGLRALKKPTLAAALVAGVALGFSPYAVYYLSHRDALAGFVSAHAVFSNTGEFLSYLSYRLRMLAEVFVSDAERRTIWGGPPHANFLTTLLSCCIFLCMPVMAWIRFKDADGKFARLLAATGCILIPFFLLSNMPVAQHHMAVLVPIGLLLMACALPRTFRPASALLFTAYLATCIWWNIQTLEGLRRTGGKSFWSSSINELADVLSREKASNIGVLDWGLEPGIEFVSSGAVSGEELFWGNTIPWASEIRNRRYFITTTGANRIFPKATSDFQQALAVSGIPYRLFRINEKDGSPFAAVYITGTPP